MKKLWILLGLCMIMLIGTVNASTEQGLYESTVAYWNFSNHMTDEISSVTGYENGATYESGIIGNAISADGSNDEANTRYNPSGATVFSANYWAKIDTADCSNTNTITWSDNTNIGLLMRYVSTSRLNVNFFTISGNAGDLNSGGNFCDNSWHMYTFVWEEDDYAILYVDGNEINRSSAVVSTAMKTLSTNITIGFYDRYNVYADVILDELAIFNKTLNTSDISYLYNSGSGIIYPYGYADTSPASPTLVTITLKDQESMVAINTFNVTLGNGSVYTTTNGTVYLPYYSNDTGLMNITTRTAGYYPSYSYNINQNTSLEDLVLSWRTITVSNRYDDSAINTFTAAIRNRNLTLEDTNGVLNSPYYDRFRNYTNNNYYAHETYIIGTYNSLYVNNLACESQNPFMIRTRDAGDPTVMLQCYNGTDWTDLQYIDDDQESSLVVSNGKAYSTTNGTAYLNEDIFNVQQLWNITLTAEGYVEQSYSNENVTLNVSLSTYQALLSANATLFLTNASVTGNFSAGTAVNATGEIMYIDNGTYSVDFTSAYALPYSVSDTVAVPFNTTTYHTFTDVYNNLLNVTFYDSEAGSSVNNFNVTLYIPTYDYSITKTTTTGLAQFNLTQNLTYYLNLSSTGYEGKIPKAVSVTPDSLYYAKQVSTVAVIACNATLNKSITFQLFHEDLPLTSLYGDMEVLVNFSTQSGYSNNVNVTFSNQTNFSICIIGENEVFADIYAQYDVTGGFTHRYYAQNMTLNLTEQLEPIYNFNYTSGISDFILTVRDQDDYSLKKDILVKMQRYYLGENAWRTVQMGKTADYGTVYYHVIEEENDYKFIFLDSNNNVLKTTNSMSFKCTDSLCELTQSVADYEGSSTSDTLDTSVTYNNNTGIVTTTWTDSTGLTYTIRSIVVRMIPTGFYTICDQSTTSASGTHTCNVSAYSGQIRATVTSSRSPLVSRLTEYFYRISDTALSSVIDRADAAFTTFIVSGTLALAAAAHPIGAILGAVTGLLVMSWTGYLNALTGAVVLIVAIMGLIVGLKVRPK